MDPELVAAIVVPTVIFLIPIIAILTHHQRKMAEIVHIGQSNTVLNPEAETLKRELSELRQVVHQQTIAIDNISRSQTELRAAMAAQEELKQRIGQ